MMDKNEVVFVVIVSVLLAITLMLAGAAYQEKVMVETVNTFCTE